AAGVSPTPKPPERADHPRNDPGPPADLAGRDLAARRDLEADRLAGAPVTARRGARPGDDVRPRAAELRRRLLRARTGRGLRARARPRRAFPAGSDLRPRRGK